MTQTALSRAALWTLLALCACSPVGSGEPAFATRRSAIINGVYDPGDPAVVAFGYVSQVAAPGDIFTVCTGTLIGPRTVLTAAHCVYPQRLRDGSPDPSYEYRVLFTSVARGPDAASGFAFDCQPPSCRSVKVASQHAHPDYASERQGTRNDIAVLELAEPALGVGPLEPNPAPILQTNVGRPIRHVGFGQTVAGDDASLGVKTHATYPVSQVLADRIASMSDSSETCFGDSGGPSLLVTPGSKVERVAGVVSYGDVTCAGAGVDTRVDAFLPWVKRTVTWERPATCDADGACLPGCEPRDPDCAGLMQACSADAQCESQTCWTDPQHREGYCTRSCGGGDFAPTCPVGTLCREGYCEKVQRREVALGEPCDPQTDFCRGFGVCTGAPGEPPRCMTACQPTWSGGATCPYSNQHCTPGSLGAYCQDPPPVVLPYAGLAEGPAAARCGATGGTGPAALGLLAWTVLASVRRRSNR